jgi:hypothetical protein
MSFGSFLFGQGQFGQGAAQSSAGAADAFVTQQVLTISQKGVTAVGTPVGSGGSSGKTDRRHLRYVGPSFSSRDRQPADRPVVVIAADAWVTGFRVRIAQRKVTVSASGTVTANSNRVRLSATAPEALGFRPLTVMVLNTKAAEDEFHLRTQHLRAGLSKRALPKLSDAEVRDIMILVLAEESDRLRTEGKIDDCHRCEEALALQLLEL